MSVLNEPQERKPNTSVELPNDAYRDSRRAPSSNLPADWLHYGIGSPAPQTRQPTNAVAAH